VLVHGDPRLGAVLRALRMEQGLTRDVVAGRVPCAPSLVSQVESGARALMPWLAGRLDEVYRTGTTVSALTGPDPYHSAHGCATLEEDDRIVLVRLPKGGVMVPVPRRALLTALGVGSTIGALGSVHEATAGVPADEELLADLTDSLCSLQAAGRILPPDRLIDPLIGQVGLLDTVRRKAPRPLGRDYLVLQAQYAEYLSWMVQESGDASGSVYWVDRARQWAEQAEWPAMIAYSHVRRSTIAGTCTGDGLLAVQHAQRVLRMGAPLMVQAQATKQMAYGYALAGRPNACYRVLDQMADTFDVVSAQAEEPDPLLGLRNIDVPALVAQYRGTCDVYLGAGERAIPLLGSSQAAHEAAAGSGSRHHAITGARLARAHAQAGDPDRACALALEALGTGGAVDSLSTRTELRRMLPPLDRWPARQDVAEVRNQITALGRPAVPSSG
jgi:hypothetical protein